MAVIRPANNIRLPAITVSGSEEPLSFSTTFSGGDENPLSEGGDWARAANDWQSVRVQSGVAKPTAFNETTTDDNYSLCQAFAPDDADVVATVFLQNGVSDAEFEILLRMSDDADSAAGYEFLYNANASVQLVRWEGPLGQFDTSVATFTESVRSTLQNGDQLRATAVGSTISGYWRRPSSSMTWTLIVQGTDSTFATGKSGIGFFIHEANAALADIGFTDFSVVPA